MWWSFSAALLDAFSASALDLLETAPIHTVKRTARTVTKTAYPSIAGIVLCYPKISAKIAWIAPFHASAATRPKAAVINAASLSITSTESAILINRRRKYLKLIGWKVLPAIKK